MDRIAYRICPLCEATCGLEVEVVEGRVKRIRGDRANPFSAGFICPKGSTLKQLHEDPDRLRTPLIREEGGHRAATWEEAFGLIARRFEEITAVHGRASLAIYLGNPNVHQLDNTLGVRPLVKALGTKNIFTAATVDQMPKHVSSGLMFGHPLNIPVPDLDRTDYLLMLGANPYESNGSLCTAPDFPGRLERLRARGGRLVVVDPRRTKTAANADRWIPIRPGTDAAFLLALAQVLVEQGRIDLGEAGPLIEGVERATGAVKEFTPELVSRFTGVDPGLIRQVAVELADASAAAIYGRIGTHTVAFGTVAAWGVDLLNALTGNLDRPGGAMFPYAAHLPDRRRGRPFRTGRWESRVRRLPEALGELPVATLADEIETPGEGQIRFLITVAGNPVVTAPDASRLDAALARLDFMVSVDPYLNETSRRADVVLPGPSALERSHYDLAFTGLSVRDYSAYSPAVFEDGGMAEFEVLARLTAIALGLGPDADTDLLAAGALMISIQESVANPESPISGRDPAEIMEMLGERAWPERFLDLMLRTGHRGDGFGADPEGLSLARLEANPHGIDFGPLQPRLRQILQTESGKVDLAPEPILADLPRLAAAAREEPEDGFLLIGRRQLRSANSWLHNVEVLVKGKERCTLQIHPGDAAELGLDDGELALVSSNTGQLEVTIEVTVDILPGVVSIPYGWGHGLPGTKLAVAATRPGVNTNLLTDTSVIDPLSGNAVLNGVPVRVAPVVG
jgi:anaerobic selenocysteine-containing dehydrogenase